MNDGLGLKFLALCIASFALGVAVSDGDDTLFWVAIAVSWVLDVLGQKLRQRAES